MPRLGVLCFLVVALAAAGVDAAPKMSSAQARKEFKAAQKLYASKRCEEALPKLTRLVEATGSPNAQLYVARCLRQLERLPDAYEAYSAALRSADEKATEDERYAATRSAAAAERAALESKVARVIVAAADPPPGLVVELNGSALAAERIGETLAVAPGKVTVSAKAPGREPFERSKDVDAGDRQTFAVVLQPQRQTAAKGTEPRPEKETSASSGSSTRTWGYVALGVGAAGLATFGVAGLMANNRYASLEDECGGSACPASKQSDIDGGKQLDLIANVGLAVGAAGVIAGTALVLLGDKKSEKTAIVVAPTRSGGTLGYSGTF